MQSNTLKSEHVEELRALEPYLRQGSWEKPSLFLSYKAEVVHVCRDQVVVIMNIDDDLVERTYNTSQFVKIPQKGDVLEIQVLNKSEQVHEPSRTRTPRKNVVPCPRTF